jgi:hypothetical protein
MKLEMPFGWLLVVALSCGGKTVGDDSPSAPGGVTAADQPAPTCTVICNRLVALCSGSPNATCESDCELTNTRYAKCPTELDRFLKCMGTTHVECTPGEVVIIDCSDERVSLQHCGQ